MRLANTTISSTLLAEATDWVRRAAANYLSNNARREWAVDGLRRTLHVSEHLARLLVELAVYSLKNPDAPAAPADPPDGP